VHEARYDVQEARLQELARTVADREDTVSRLHRELELARSAVDAAAAVNASASASARAAEGTTTTGFAARDASSSSSGIQELSAKVGQQSTAISSLESKLRDAVDTIVRLKQRPAPAPEQEQEDELDKTLLIREMVQEFVQRRHPTAASGSNAASSRGREHWSHLMLQETRFIAEARRVLREEKAAIRWEQQQLLKRRDAWKSEGNARSSGTQQLLNQQTVSLNAAVEQARRTSDWLTERERKLGILQKLAPGAGTSPAADAQLEQVAAELDADLRGLGLGFHGLQQQSLNHGFNSGGLPSRLEQFCASLGARSSYFPSAPAGPSLLGGQQGQGRNTYMEAQAENVRPLLHRPPYSTDTAGASENAAPNAAPQQQQQQVADPRKAAREVDCLSLEREQAQAACDGHIGWLAGLRKDITAFQQPQPQQGLGQGRGSGRAFIDAVVQDTFEL
jgi:uncharacterized coiled-coil protein SlyX